MDDLTAFLAARLDESETFIRIARLAAKARGKMKREVEADRGLLDLYERARGYRDRVFSLPEPRSISDEMRAVTQMIALEQVMRLRAAIYSDHPDYRPQWKP